MGFKISKVFKSGGAVGSIIGAGIGAMTGNPAIGAEIGGSIGSMVGPSDERLQRRQEIQAQRDAISFWNMQNEYNSPLQQRIRLEQAGLNPYALNGSVPDNIAGSLSVPSVSYRSKRKGNWSAVEKFFLNKSMQNAEDQNTRNELINENWRLRNLKLAKQIEDTGHVALSDKVRSSDPFTVDMNTTVDDIMSNPNLTTKEKREYVTLVKKLHPTDRPVGFSTDPVAYMMRLVESLPNVYKWGSKGGLWLRNRLKNNPDWVVEDGYLPYRR